MAKAARNVILSPLPDIPFDNLVLSRSNARHIKTRVSVEDIGHKA